MDLLRISFKIMLVAVVSLCSVATTFAVSSTPKIRVRIAKNVPVVSIAGMDLNRKFLSDNSKKHYPGRKRIKFNCNNINYKKYRKKGYGSAIVRRLIGRAAELGCYKVLLDSAERNVKFYERLGLERKEVAMMIYFG